MFGRSYLSLDFMDSTVDCFMGSTLRGDWKRLGYLLVLAVCCLLKVLVISRNKVFSRLLRFVLFLIYSLCTDIFFFLVVE